MLPFRGWHEDYREDKCDGYYPVFQQNRAEFTEFVALLEQRESKLRCLQIGLGAAGGTHVAFSEVFEQVWTIEISSMLAGGFTQRYPEFRDGILIGSSDDAAIQQHCAALAPFDLLFIDGDHSYAAVKRDLLNYGLLVGVGGMIAFHDVCQRGEGLEVWRLAEEVPMTIIGQKLGIGYRINGP